MFCSGAIAGREQSVERHPTLGTRVTVRQWRDGSLEVHHEGVRLRYRELEVRPPKPPKPASPGRRLVKPSSQHPWRRYPAVLVPKR